MGSFHRIFNSLPITILGKVIVSLGTISIFVLCLTIIQDLHAPKSGQQEAVAKTPAYSASKDITAEMTPASSESVLNQITALQPAAGN